MNIEYKSSKIRIVCEDPQKAQKEYGKQIANKLTQRVGEIKAADNLHTISLIPAAELHILQGKRQNQYAVTLVHPFRLVFSTIVKKGVDITNLKEIEIVKIEEVVDYHGKKKR
jgi:proteic killer suppression protein